MRRLAEIVGSVADATTTAAGATREGCGQLSSVECAVAIGVCRLEPGWLGGKIGRLGDVAIRIGRDAGEHIGPWS